MSYPEAMPLPYSKCNVLHKDYATGYTTFLSAFSDVGERSKTIAAAELAFRGNLAGILESFQMKPADLARASKAIRGPSRKTIYNLLSGTHPPNLKTWASAAEALQVPLWTILIPGLAAHKELLRPESLRAIERLINDYMACDVAARDEIRRVAEACVIIARHRKR